MRRLLRNLALYAFHIGFVRPALRWVVGLRYRRRALVPRGPCLIVSNHNSHLDAAILMGLFPLRRLAHVHPVAAADYFGKSWLRRTLAMLLMNGIPIDRRPAPGFDALGPVADKLREGESLIFFPEGSRGEAGVVARFRPGVGRLVHLVPGLLVVPVFLSGPERIWPRGQIPVPLNSDAVVGRPRTYSTEGDARVIAERVQRDVLSLAPPPPPLPGPRHEPLRVAVCGGGAVARERVFRTIVERLGRSGRTLGVAETETVVEADADGPREVTSPITHAPGRASLGLLARIFRTGGRFAGQKFAEMIERARVDEALGRDHTAAHLVTQGSALVDLMAWAVADFYQGVFDDSGLNHMMQFLAGQKKIPFSKWWRFIRKAPEVWLVNVLELAQPPVPDLLVLLTEPTSRVMERLLSTGEQLQAHENEPFLQRLQEGYQQVGDVLAKRRKTAVLEFDASRMRQEAIAEEVVEVCGRLVERPASGGRV
jgi:1-acyl-sn-glycerol-3-phosphate acyltransferase